MDPRAVPAADADRLEAPVPGAGDEEEMDPADLARRRERFVDWSEDTLRIVRDA